MRKLFNPRISRLLPAWLLGLCLLLSGLAAPALAQHTPPASRSQPATAQEQVATDDIEFTPIEEAKPAAAPTAAAAADVPAATVAAPVATAPAATAAVSPPAPKAVPMSLWVTFLTGLLGGFAAVFMPCIFPLLPMTVSFFTKRAGTRSQGLRKAFLYGGSIVVIYVALGLLITVLFGADALNNLATNGVFNLGFFVLLVVFAASFLGAFEITLPNSWVTKADTEADKGGTLGIFFMAATLALVSFSCTGPIIGTLLVQAATSGAYLGPAIGMLGFSLALAAPFTLLSLFPGWLTTLPKSGGWLNSVKVVLGFLELALALKFLSNVDLAYHWEWFDREVFLVLWIVIFAMLGFYLLGKLQFSHDSPLPFVTLPRLFLAIIVFAFTTYLVPGLWGAPLRAVAAFLPPQTTQDFDLYTASLGGGPVASNPAAARTAHKYQDIFKAPLRLNAYFDYDEGMAAAKAAGKPVLIDFTGHACVNCRKMEAVVWPTPAVLPVLRDQYVLIQLYVDDKTELAAAEQTVSKFSGKQIRTIGNKWSDLQASRFNSNSQPFYVLLGADGRQLAPPQGADYEPANFAAFLQSGLKAL